MPPPQEKYIERKVSYSYINVVVVHDSVS